MIPRKHEYIPDWTLKIEYGMVGVNKKARDKERKS